MKERALPVQIKPARLAKEAVALSGELPLTNEPRVQQLLVEDAPHSMVCSVRAYRDAEGLHIAGEMNGKVTMTCQVCLQPVSIDVSRVFQWLVVSSDEQAKRVIAEDEPVFMDADGFVSLHDNLLDELLLDLPIAPVHAESEQCAHRHLLGAGECSGEREITTQRPFKELKALLSK